MAFSDPTSITVNAVSKSLAKVYTLAGAPSTYKAANDEFVLEIAHQEVKGGKRERHLIKVTQMKIVPDPLNAAYNMEAKTSAHIVIENPKMGFTDIEIGYLVKALTDYVGNASNQAKLIGGEA